MAWAHVFLLLAPWSDDGPNPTCHKHMEVIEADTKVSTRRRPPEMTRLATVSWHQGFLKECYRLASESDTTTAMQAQAKTRGFREFSGYSIGSPSRRSSAEKAEARPRPRQFLALGNREPQVPGPGHTGSGGGVQESATARLSLSCDSMCDAGARQRFVPELYALGLML